MKYYIYELHDPRVGQVFYVGMGTGARAEKHFKYFDDTDHSFKSNVIRKIIQSGLVPIIKKVFFTNDRQLACTHERELIQHYGRRCDNSGILVNIALGGDGGDTVTGCSTDKINNRYAKRAETLQSRLPEQVNLQYTKSSEKIKIAWEEKREQWSLNIKNGINTNRDKKAHAIAVSKGWENRTESQKEETSKIRTRINNERWTNPVTRDKMLRGAKIVSIPVKITTSSGEIYYADSLMGWCKTNNESYGVLWNIMSGKAPKENKYKRSKYLGWTVEKISQHKVKLND
jgi:hypothetical protein